MTAAALIGIDWGTTSFRAYRIDAAGNVLESREAPAGILAVRDRDFAAVLARETGAWLAAEPGVPVVASGMITSRQGWLEVPYRPCPAGSAEIAAALMRHPARPDLRFVPGLSFMATDGVPDVMRGEETQILGALRSSVALQSGRHLVCLPGTHTKWVVLEDGVVREFLTSVTGELFAVPTCAVCTASGRCRASR